MSRTNDADLTSLIKDLQKQIHYLEKKVDILIAQSGGGGRSSSMGSIGSAKPKRFGPKGPKVGFGNSRSSSGHGASTGSTYPKKNESYNPSNRKNTDKPRKRKTTSTFKRRK